MNEATFARIDSDVIDTVAAEMDMRTKEHEITRQ